MAFSVGGLLFELHTLVVWCALFSLVALLPFAFDPQWIAVFGFVWRVFEASLRVACWCPSLYWDGDLLDDALASPFEGGDIVVCPSIV